MFDTLVDILSHASGTHVGLVRIKMPNKKGLQLYCECVVREGVEPFLAPFDFINLVHVNVAREYYGISA